jgi:hypothetical protein
MIAAGVLLSISAFFILKSENLLLRGMLIPVGLVAMNLGYGSVLILRPSTSPKTETALLEDRASGRSRNTKDDKDAR